MSNSVLYTNTLLTDYRIWRKRVQLHAYFFITKYENSAPHGVTWTGRSVLRSTGITDWSDCSARLLMASSRSNASG